MLVLLAGVSHVMWKPCQALDPPDSPSLTTLAFN